MHIALTWPPFHLTNCRTKFLRRCRYLIKICPINKKDLVCSLLHILLQYITNSARMCKGGQQSSHTEATAESHQLTQSDFGTLIGSEDLSKCFKL